MSDSGNVLFTVKVDALGHVISRPNRFLLLADVELPDGTVYRNEKVHVHDPGRLKEILYPGNVVQLRKADREGRRTSWDLVSGKVGGKWVLVNSSYHRYIAESILSSPFSPVGRFSSLRAEVRAGASRLDFHLTVEDGKVHYVEVKGCTLSRDGRALFPDAPTTRGTRHLRELIRLKEEGCESDVLVLVLAPDTECFIPNAKCDPEFARAFRDAVLAGVNVHPVALEFDGMNVSYGRVLPLCVHSEDI
ncbi:DNA/RNA nuclease SfsA [Thermoplasmatales archaeon ex4484_6]|nr:MAG: DNA/RNA nuclease SfsA [Thermoplasmatales archaeon ex4484_6]RLF68308.1 MAG: DNA/RNA nuclease SfsA [Thermoplasmata archaeon]